MTAMTSRASWAATLARASLNRLAGWNTEGRS